MAELCAPPARPAGAVLEPTVNAAGGKCTELASVVGASAATNSHTASSLQVCWDAALRRCLSYAVTQACTLWLAVRRDKIDGREDVGIELLQWGAQVPGPNLSALARPLIERGISQRLSVWPFLAVTALSPTNMCSRMLAGSSTASSMTSCLVEDVETVGGAFCVAACALEVTISSLRHFALRNPALAGRVERVYILCT